MLGGYQAISLMDDNIYQKIVNSNSKAILVGDIVIDGVRKNSVYVPVTIAAGVVTFNAYGKQYTIVADNSITAVDHTQAEIYYFASLDAVPADLPDGSFVAVPSEGGGGLPSVVIYSNVLSTLENAEPITLTTDEGAQLDTAIATSTGGYMLLTLYSDNIPAPITLNAVGYEHEEDDGAEVSAFLSLMGTAGQPLYVILTRANGTWSGIAVAMSFTEV